jgi:ribonucleoside-diphosphate reductase alpha chain
MHPHKKVKKATLQYFDNDELATNVFMTKYCLKDKEGNYIEKTPDDMHKRLAKEFARVEESFYRKNRKGNPLSFEEIYELFKDFKYIVPQGSPMFGIGNEYVNASLSNCVVVKPPEDSISSIMESGKELANLFKNRCGVGIDISSLRPENSSVNNAAKTTTGAWSFADFYSYVCRMIGQNGRRGALMISMDVRHPDIEKFVTMKHDLTKVTGANVSVKITDEFMRAVEEDKLFSLEFPVGANGEAKIKKDINARQLWKSIVSSATKTAEPGLLMWDNITRRLPANEYEEFKTICVNPCAEIALSAYDSCRLISINLKNFVNDPFSDNALFDFTKFNDVVRVAMRLSDDLVELELEKLTKIKEACDSQDECTMWENLLQACRNGRRTGLGTHGLADTIACLGLKYDSSRALTTIDGIYKILKVAAYEESVNLAKERGAFPVFDWEREKNNEFIAEMPKALKDKIKKYGRRNISILTNAPTGSVSIMSQTSTGIEPVFRNSYIRRRKLAHNEQHLHADFTDEMGDKWHEYEVFHHNVKDYLNFSKKEKIPNYFVTSEEIDWQKRVEVQAAIQKHIDHSISSTINLPRDTNPDIVGDLYFQGWKKGLKGITVYVEGSRDGVLLSKEDVSSNAEFPQHKAPKRPQQLECDLQHTTIKGEKWVVLVGMLNGMPYEVMGGNSDLIEIPKKYSKGVLIKNERKTTNSRYDLRFGENGNEIVIKDVVKVFDNPNHSAFTRMISLSLRHGAKINFLVEQMMKDRDSDMFSFAKCIARVLKKYIADGDKVNGTSCPECKKDLIYVDGCESCNECGYAKCS